MTDNQFTRGSNEHAVVVTDGRWPETRDALLWLTFRHLPPALQPFSRPFYVLAEDIIAANVDSPELTKALNHLTEAKDWAVRAGIRTQQGRAGSVARPQTLVDPPQFPQTLTAPPEGGIPGAEKFGIPGEAPDGR